LFKNVELFYNFLAHVVYKAVSDRSVSNIRSLIHIVILQSLGDTTFFKRAAQLKPLEPVITNVCMLQQPRGTAEIRKNSGHFVLKYVVNYPIKCLNSNLYLYERKLNFLSNGIHFITISLKNLKIYIYKDKKSFENIL